MTDWMTIRVVLTGREGTPLPLPAGRVLLANTDHTFADLAEAIDTAFGRWDLTPLHEFEVGERYLISDLDSAGDSEGGAEQSDRVRLGDIELRPGARMRYTFDLGERWLHECDIEAAGANPIDLYGEEPEIPVPIFGWGAVPDQYGRVREEEDEDEADVEALADLVNEGLMDSGVDEAGLGITGRDTDLDEALDEGEPDWEEEEEEEDDEAFLAAWDEARAVAWQVVESAVAEVDRRLDAEELHRVTTALRTHAGSRRYPYDVLWAAADLGELPEDDRTLWIALAAAVVEPEGELPVDLEVEAAWAMLEPADWAGAVIELTRAGIGQSAEPQELVALIARCPEIEGPELTEEDVASLEAAFTPVVDLWRILGALDERHRLTALGRWGLPEALRTAWLGPTP